jgi:hypothetical protein
MNKAEIVFKKLAEPSSIIPFSSNPKTLKRQPRSGLSSMAISGISSSRKDWAGPNWDSGKFAEARPVLNVMKGLTKADPKTLKTVKETAKPPKVILELLGKKAGFHGIPIPKNLQRGAKELEITGIPGLKINKIGDQLYYKIIKLPSDAKTSVEDVFGAQHRKSVVGGGWSKHAKYPCIGQEKKAKHDMPSFTKQDRPAKVKEIYRALKRDHPEMPAGKKARIAESTYNKMS